MNKVNVITFCDDQFKLLMADDEIDLAKFRRFGLLCRKVEKIIREGLDGRSSSMVNLTMNVLRELQSTLEMGTEYSADAKIVMEAVKRERKRLDKEKKKS